MKVASTYNGCALKKGFCFFFFGGGCQLLGQNLKKKRVIRKERFILTHDLRIEEVSQGKKAWCQQLEAAQQLCLQSERR